MDILSSESQRPSHIHWKQPVLLHLGHQGGDLLCVQQLRSLTDEPDIKGREVNPETLLMLLKVFKTNCISLKHSKEAVTCFSLVGATISYFDGD